LVPIPTASIRIPRRQPIPRPIDWCDCGIDLCQCGAKYPGTPDTPPGVFLWHPNLTDHPAEGVHYNANEHWRAQSGFPSTFH
jgi:hypothetical protein